MKSLILAALFALSACAPSLVSGNAAGGTITMGTSMKAVLATADAECAKYGKVAKSQGTNAITNSLRYECVAP